MNSVKSMKFNGSFLRAFSIIVIGIICRASAASMFKRIMANPKFQSMAQNELNNSAGSSAGMPPLPGMPPSSTPVDQSYDQQQDQQIQQMQQQLQEQQQQLQQQHCVVASVWQQPQWC